MSASTAIGMVSSSLRSLLAGEMRLTPPPDVTILAPDERGSQRRINLFLYKVAENPYLKNEDWTVRPADPNQLVAPPLSLNLFYLLTPYAPNDQVTGNAIAHQMLGEAMRVLYENPVVPPAYLDPGLVDAWERLQIASNALDSEELGRIWTTFSQPFRLSVPYQVSTVQLDQRPTAPQPVPQRVRRVGVPEVRQPYAPPVVDRMAPVSCPAGTTLTFSGTSLEGWQATVLVGGHPVLESQALTGGTFTAVVPAGLAPGGYDVRVDVSGLFRRGFLLEVTP